MSEFSRTTYSFNSRLVLNDDTTDPDAFVLVDPSALMDTLAANIQEPKPTEAGIIDYGVKFNQGLAVIPVQLIATSEAKMAQLIEDVKEAFNPDLLEATAVISLNDEFHRITEGVKSKFDFLDSKQIFFEWEEALKRYIKLNYPKNL